MDEGEVSTRHIFITVFIFILSSVQNSAAVEKEEDSFYEGSGNTSEENDVIILPWTGVVIFIGAILCVCGGCIGVICICLKKCKKTSAALNEHGNPYKETGMPEVPPTGSNSNVNPAPPSGYAPVPTHSPTFPMDHKPDEKHQPPETNGYPMDQKPIEKYQPPEPFGYPSGQQTHIPSPSQAQHGFNDAQSRYRMPQPVQNGPIPIQSGYGPAQPGHGPTQPWNGPTQPGYGPTQLGYGPTQPGYGATQPGYESSQLEYEPAQPKNVSAQSGYILAQPVYNSGQPNVYNKQS